MSLRSLRSSRAAPQQGAVLFVAMIVLVALAVAALALLRSTDVAGLLAGNLSFKESALNATDIGYQKAYGLFPMTATTGDDATKCYSATQQNIDARGVPVILNNTASFDLAYPACSYTVPATGELVRFYIERLCTVGGVAYANRCDATHVLPSGQWTNGSPNLTTTASTFRVTLRVDGARNTTAYSQIIGRQ